MACETHYHCGSFPRCLVVLPHRTRNPFSFFHLQNALHRFYDNSIVAQSFFHKIIKQKMRVKLNQWAFRLRGLKRVFVLGGGLNGQISTIKMWTTHSGSALQTIYFSALRSAGRFFRLLQTVFCICTLIILALKFLMPYCPESLCGSVIGAIFFASLHEMLSSLIVHTRLSTDAIILLAEVADWLPGASGSFISSRLRSLITKRDTLMNKTKSGDVGTGNWLLRITLNSLRLHEHIIAGFFSQYIAA